MMRGHRGPVACFFFAVASWSGGIFFFCIVARWRMGCGGVVAPVAQFAVALLMRFFAAPPVNVLLLPTTTRQQLLLLLLWCFLRTTIVPRLLYATTTIYTFLGHFLFKYE